MDKTRAFTIDRPWYSILAAGHVPEVFNATQRDAFGLRGRLTICVPHPKFQTLEEVVAACNELCVPSHTPADFLASLLYPVLEDSLKHAEGDILMFLPCVDFAFGFFAVGSCFREAEISSRILMMEPLQLCSRTSMHPAYKLPAFAVEVCLSLLDRGTWRFFVFLQWQKHFEAHMTLQEEAYCRRGEHEVSKKHGKLRTKYNRFAWGVHVLTELCQLFLRCREQEGFAMEGA